VVGRLLSETETSVELLDTLGKPQAFARKDLALLESKEASLMAEGWESLGEEELGDLLEFLRRGD
jgi:hypothetical protein